LNFIGTREKKIRVFLTPLDWGLGHATRCIPLIKELQKQHFEVFVGASGKIASLLQKEFPGLTIIPFEGYGINYAKSRLFFMLRILMQLPKILICAWRENRQVKKIVADFQIDVIISDNRLGCYHKKIPSVFITHQLQLLTGNKLLDRLAMASNYFFINRFSECWIPDLKGENNLGGSLSHPKRLPKLPIRYIGYLSRFSHKETATSISLTILISGPEPQRTIFEDMIISQLERLDKEALIIRGLPENKPHQSRSSEKIRFVNHAQSYELEAILQQSEMIIARSGYSTVMDLMALQKKAILIPTPGQTEQEYLAATLMKKKLFFTVSQHEFNLQKNLEEAKHFKFERSVFTSDVENEIFLWKEKLRYSHSAS